MVGLLGSRLHCGLGEDMLGMVAWASIGCAIGGGGRGLFRSVGVLDKFGDDIPGANSRVGDPIELFGRAIACGAFSLMALP